MLCNWKSFLTRVREVIQKEPPWWWAALTFSLTMLLFELAKRISGR